MACSATPYPHARFRQVGQVVWVPLRGKPALGVIVRLHDDRRRSR